MSKQVQYPDGLEDISRKQSTLDSLDVLNRGKTEKGGRFRSSHAAGSDRVLKHYVPPAAMPRYLRQLGVVDVPGELHAGGSGGRRLPLLSPRGGPHLLPGPRGRPWGCWGEGGSPPAMGGGLQPPDIATAARGCLERPWGLVLLQVGNSPSERAIVGCS